MTTRGASVPSFPTLLQDFFCQRLIAQRQASGRTVASYRDAFRLLLRYATTRTGKAPTALTLADLDAPLVLGFLSHLESQRGNGPRSRNARLAAVRSFMRYASFQDPASLPVIERVMAIPMKRFDRPLLGFLTKEEMDAILDIPARSTWTGQRDYVMLATFYNTGARVSEIAALRRRDIAQGSHATVHLHGKGRKQRVVPLWRSTAAALATWLRRDPRDATAPLFPNHRGASLSRSGIEHRLRVAVGAAAARCPSLVGRRVSPHTLRHTTAMHLLTAGVDITVIALWLGHESPATTHMYVEADLAMKERALRKLQPPTRKALRYKASDRLLSFLDGL
jgi:integrase/recombinase XerD